jgi:hypothetical protein
LPTHNVKGFSDLEIMQYQYPASHQNWKTATEPLRFWLFNKTVWSNMQNSLHQNLPTHIVKVFSNLEIMQYQYPASNQYMKTATEPLRFWLFNKTVWSNMQNSLDQNLPTQIAKVFSN